MNATNRAVNRAILCIVGILLTALGAAVTLITVWPYAGELWRTGGSAALAWLQDADQRSRVSEGSAVSWLTIGVLVLLAAIVVVAVVVIARLGGGRSAAVIRAEAGADAQGPVTIQHGFMSDALTHSLAQHDEILTTRVRAARVRGADVLHVSVTPRQHTSPVEVAETVTRLVDNLAVLTGQDTPTMVSLHAGVRARFAADLPRVQ